MRMFFLVVLCALAACAGEYKGKWVSARSGNSGAIRLSLETGAEMSFTYQGSEVKAKVARATVDGGAVEVEFHFTIDGSELKSVYTATRSDGKLTGKYVTSVRSEGTPVDGGSIEAAEGN